MDKAIKIFQTPAILAESFAADLVIMLTELAGKNKAVTIALSGGSTPELLFTVLGDKYCNSVAWEFVHFFWGDERCVPPDNSDSNFGLAKRTFLDKIAIPSSNIHRINGENNPSDEALRYSSEITSFTLKKNGLPSFDIVLLGLGEDGHTASIFPGHISLLTSDKICDVAVNPYSGQKRITISGKLINNAAHIFFLATGQKKAEIIKNIFKKNSASLNYPASYIVPFYGQLQWYLDNDAVSLL